jgi:hypothetical protein
MEVQGQKLYQNIRTTIFGTGQYLINRAREFKDNLNYSPFDGVFKFEGPSLSEFLIKARREEVKNK